MFAFSMVEMAVFGVILLVVFAILFPKAYYRIKETIQAKVGKGSSNIWGSDPESVGKIKVEKREQEIRDLTVELGEINGKIQERQQAIADGEREVANLDAVIKKYMAPGGDREKARAKAISLAHERTKLENNTKSVAISSETYKNKSAELNMARKEVAEWRERLKNRGEEMKESEVDLHINQMFQKMDISGGSIEDSFKEVEEVMNAKIYKNRGMTQAMKDVGSNGLERAKEKQDEQAAQADAILAEYETSGK